MTRFKKVSILIPSILLLILLVFVVRGHSPLYLGAVSDHFDGARFFNEEQGHSFIDMIKWFWEMETVEWPEWIDDPSQPKPVESVDDGQIKVTHINHATILIQMDGINILTDPIWSDRASPASWAGTKRIRAPGIKFEDLPHIDFILISHDHYDHLDIPTLKKLVKRNQPRIFVGLGVKSILESEGIPLIHQMDWWQDHKIQNDNIKITFVPARHNSGRSFFGKNRTLWGGFVIEGKSGRVYFAGDTAYGKFLDALKKHFSEFDLTVFPIGNYEKRWFMKTQHMNPDDAVQAHVLLNSRQSVGMHYATFLEHPEQSIDAHEKDLETAMIKHNVAEFEFWILKFGEGRYIKR
ncbi:MBL fold metallo-hydrolase [Thermodesulfobacteriota bacterium]